MGRTHAKGGGKAKKKGGHRPGGGGVGPSSSHRRPRKLEISFDPASRRDYLTGFSSRKKERRAFGLAMQKVKDRKAKLEERKEQREAKLGEIEDIERNKRALRAGDGDDGEDAGEVDAGDIREEGEQETKTFRDERTALQFGGAVSVTTTFGIPSDDGDSDDDGDFFARAKHGAGHVDEAQRKAGNVNSYIAEVKGTMGNKKKGGHHGEGNKKGQHGASSMKGMGKGGELKVAKRALAKFKAKGGREEREGERKGGKGRKRKGRR